MRSVRQPCLSGFGVVMLILWRTIEHAVGVGLKAPSDWMRSAAVHAP